MSSPPIVLIHGLWMTPRSWDNFAERYTAAGHAVHAPSWPGLEGDVEAIRADPVAAGVADHRQDRRPLRPVHPGTRRATDHHGPLLRRPLHAAPRGPRSRRGRCRCLGGPASRRPEAAADDDRVGITDPAQPAEPAQGRGVHARGLPLHDDEHAVARGVHAVLRALRHPGRRTHPLRRCRCPVEPTTAAKVDFSRTDRAPMLFIANGSDHVVPTSVTKAIYHKYHKKSTALVEYVEYPDRPHFPGVPAGKRSPTRP